jgi:hypothetical protein
MQSSPGRGLVSRSLSYGLPLTGSFVRRWFGSHRFLSGPPVPLPCSRTPAAPYGSATISPFWFCPRTRKNEGRNIHRNFEALSHGFNTRCLRFRLRLPSSARLASSWRQILYWWGIEPRSTRRISTQCYTVYSYASGFACRDSRPSWFASRLY